MNIDEKPLQHADKAVDGFVKKIGGIESTFKKVAEVAAGGFLVEKGLEFVKTQVESATALKRQAEVLGTTTDELQKFRLALTESGISAETADVSMRFLSKTIGEAATGSGEAAGAFQRAGIQIKDVHGKTRPLLDVVGDLADHFQKVDDPAKRSAEAMKLLGRQGAFLIPLLGKGSKAIKEAAKDFEELGGGIGEDFIEEAEKAEKQSAKFSFALTGLKTKVVQAVLPAMTSLIEKGIKWIGKAVEFTKKTNVVKTAVIAFGIAAADALAPLAFELAVPLLSLAALYLIFDDLFTLMTGGKSLIGDLIDKLFGVGTSKEVVAEVKAIWEDLVAFWNSDAKSVIVDLVKAIGITLVEAMYGLVTVGKLIGHAFMFAFEAIGGSISKASEAVEDMKNDLKDFGKFHGSLLESVQGNKPILGAPTVSAPSILGPAAYGGNQNNKVEINISEAKNADETATKVSKAVGRQMASFQRGNNRAYGAFGGTDTGS